jgi:hypothetical protein
VRAFKTLLPIIAAALLAASLVVSGQGALAATALGLVGTTAFLYGTWVVVQLASAGAVARKPTVGQALIVALALLLKIPLIYAGWLLSQRLGPFAPAWFLGGLALVYCALVWRAVLAVRD